MPDPLQSAQAAASSTTSTTYDPYNSSIYIGTRADGSSISEVKSLSSDPYKDYKLIHTDKEPTDPYASYQTRGVTNPESDPYADYKDAEYNREVPDPYAGYQYSTTPILSPEDAEDEAAHMQKKAFGAVTITEKKAESGVGSGDGTTYPYWGIWSTKKDTFAWVHLTAYPNYQVGASARNPLQKPEAERKTFKLLFQNKDFSWSADHTWEAYKGWATTLGNTASHLLTGLDKVKSFASTIKETTQKALADGAAAALNHASNSEPIPYRRFDQSIVYTNSSNRSCSLSFEFIVPPNFSEAEKTLWSIITEIEKYSYPTSGGTLDFTPPDIWDVRIVSPNGGGTIWFLEHCGLTSVKTSISGPFKGNIPAVISLDLAFKHLPAAFQQNGWWNKFGSSMSG